MSQEIKNLVLFWGWSRGESSYQKLKESAPEVWNIYILSYEDLMPIGNRDWVQKSIQAFMRDHNIDKACLLGHSLGGAIALEFAFHHPEMVEKLYLADSEGVYEKEHPIRLLYNAIQPGPGSRKNPIEDIKSLTRVARKPLLNIKLAHHAHHANLLVEAQGLKVPTTIIWGEKDRLTPLRQGQKLHDLIPGSKLIVLPGEGHDWVLHKPELFWQNI